MPFKPHFSDDTANWPGPDGGAVQRAMHALLRMMSILLLVTFSAPTMASVWSVEDCSAGAPCDDAEDESEQCPLLCDHCVFGAQHSRVVVRVGMLLPLSIVGMARRAL